MRTIFGIIKMFLMIIIAIPVIVIYIFVMFMAWLSDKSTYSKTKKYDYYGPLN